MKKVQLHVYCNFSLIYHLNDSTHLIVQNLTEIMEFMVITNIRPTIGFLQRDNFLTLLIGKYLLTKSVEKPEMGTVQVIRSITLLSQK